MKLKLEKIKSNNGFTGIEITVALILLMIFISLVSMLFSNIYLSYTSSRRNSEATAYATQIMELVQKMYYADITSQTLASKIAQMNIPNGYGVQVEVENYQDGDNSKEDLVKTVKITMNYKVGNQSQSVKFETIKAKEILITPNKPILEENMVPVKYVITNRTTGQGYWQVSAEDDPTWYSYENKKWATVMIRQGLTVEGGVTVTAENQKSLVGKKVETAGELKVWIPRYAYKVATDSTSVTQGANIEFLYSTSNNYVDENGNMQDIAGKEGYIIHQAFHDDTQGEYAGLWQARYGNGITSAQIETNLQNIASNDLANTLLGAVAYLVYSEYGNISNLQTY